MAFHESIGELLPWSSWPFPCHQPEFPSRLFIEAEKDIRVVCGCKQMVAKGSSLPPKDDTSVANFPQVKNPNKTEKAEREHRPNDTGSCPQWWVPRVPWKGWWAQGCGRAAESARTSVWWERTWGEQEGELQVSKTATGVDTKEHGGRDCHEVRAYRTPGFDSRVPHPFSPLNSSVGQVVFLCWFTDGNTEPHWTNRPTSHG